MTTRTDIVSDRVEVARLAARERLRSQRALLRPLGWAVIAVVTATALTTSPTAGLRAASGGVSLALMAYAAATIVAIRDSFVDRPAWVQAAWIAAMGSAGVALVALQPRGATDLAAGAAVWMGLARLRMPVGVGLGIVITAGQDLAALVGGATAASVLAASLLNALLGLVASIVRVARDAQDRTELLLAQLADAQDEQAHAAALAERGRIAADLHDVLAHCLSGAAIQLQGARVLLVRVPTDQRVQVAVERASELVNDGLANARAAVGALRGESPPGIADLQSLVEGYRRDLLVPATLTVQGHTRPLPVETGLVLYRAAQEALTNTARYSPGTPTTVLLSYERGRTCLCVENAAAVKTNGAAAAVGGGHGLIGLAERVERVGGTLRAGPHQGGWRVEVQVPT